MVLFLFIIFIDQFICYFIKYTHTHTQIDKQFIDSLSAFWGFFSFKMGKYSAGMRMLGNTMAKSFDTLTLLSVYLAIALVVFSAMIYFAECGNPMEVNGEIIYAREGQDFPR